MLKISGNLGSTKVQDICDGLESNAMITPLPTNENGLYYAYITENKIAFVPFCGFWKYTTLMNTLSKSG